MDEWKATHGIVFRNEMWSEDVVALVMLRPDGSAPLHHEFGCHRRPWWSWSSENGWLSGGRKLTGVWSIVRVDEVPANSMVFEVGDIVTYTQDRESSPLFRLITEVRPTGYTWEYLDRGVGCTDEDYESEASSDPMMTVWTRVLCGARRH